MPCMPGVPRLAAATAAGLLLVACQSSRSGWRPQPPQSPLVLDQRDRPPNVRSGMAPGTRIALSSPPRAETGIPLPGGGALPALNGVTASGVVRRPPEAGPLEPVVAVIVDDDGLEWYQHADGSLTTSRWTWDKDRHRWEAITAHAIAAR